MPSPIRCVVAAAAVTASLAIPARVLAAQGRSEAQIVGGVVRDAVTGTPIVAATVELSELSRAMRTDGAGRFRFLVRSRSTPYELRVRRIGYAAVAREAAPGDTSLVVTLAPSAVDLAPVKISAVQGGAEGFRPASSLEGAALDRRLTTSIAATIAGEPGVTMRTNGPIAAQPVIRGLTGDRVLVLEDGQRTGDIATTAPDHAVTIDPLAAQRIEVLRGPAGLLFGSNTLGGVVNVVREDVPRARPDGRVSGYLAAQGESANDGRTLGGAVTTAVGPVAMRVAGTRRLAGDTRTPRGALPFSDVEGHDLGAGASLPSLAIGGGDAFVGAAVRDVHSAYGVPSGFGGLTLPGAHVGGVYVDLRRSSARVEGEWRAATGDAEAQASDGAFAIRRIAAAGQYVRFEQSELERGGFVGTRFGQLMANGDLVVRYVRGGRVPSSGAIGAWGQWRDFRAEGSFTGTRPAVLRAGALFAMEELRLDSLVAPLGFRVPLRLMAGARLDGARISPLDSTETRLLQGVRTRAFRAMSGSVALAAEPSPGWTLGVAWARAFRPPAIEELYSAGPHLASYAYEIGNPSLQAETGNGIDVFARMARAHVTGEVALFTNRVNGFIYQRPLVDAATGLPVRDVRLGRYNVYQAAQADARLTGIEGRVTIALAPSRVPGLAVDAVASWVHGTRVAGGDETALPAMPPLRARLALRRERPAWSWSLGLDAAQRQGRVPSSTAVAGPATAAGVTCRPAARTTSGGQVEAVLLPAEFCPTPGFALLEASIARRWLVGGRLHAVSLGIDNALDAVWRDHLWRAKQVAPQPGRNVRLSYRVTL